MPRADNPGSQRSANCDVDAQLRKARLDMSKPYTQNGSTASPVDYSQDLRCLHILEEEPYMFLPASRLITLSTMAISLEMAEMGCHPNCV